MEASHPVIADASAEVSGSAEAALTDLADLRMVGR